MVKNKTKSTAVTDKKLADLKTVSLMTRMWIINMTHEAGSGHPGGSLSATDIVSTLYFHVMKHDPRRNSDWENRDRFILSKGHAAPALYAALAQSGYFEKELIFIKNNKNKIAAIGEIGLDYKNWKDKALQKKVWQAVTRQTLLFYSN